MRREEEGGKEKVKEWRRREKKGEGYRKVRAAYKLLCKEKKERKNER